MPLIKMSKGLEANLPNTHEEGQLYFTTDSGKIFLDIDDENRKQVGGQDYVTAGLNSTASSIGERATAEGWNNFASGQYAHVEGGDSNSYMGNRASGQSSHAEGRHTSAIGNYSHAEGGGSVASGEASHAEGSGLQYTGARASAAHAEGLQTTAMGPYAHSEGEKSIAAGRASHSEGLNVVAYGDYSHAEGRQSDVIQLAEVNGSGTTYTTSTYVSETYIDAMVIYQTGNNVATVARILTINNQSFDTQRRCTFTTDKALSSSELTNAQVIIRFGASGTGAHSEGTNTRASGESSHTEGVTTWTQGMGAHAEGGNTRAFTDFSHAEGDTTEASGEASHAEGYQTIASGYASHAEGTHSEARGTSSHAEGGTTVASGWGSHAEGHGTTAGGLAQHVFGEYNTPDLASDPTERAQYVEIVGNGTAANRRSNARTLDWNGNQWLQGDLKIGGYSYSDPNAKTVATQEWVTSQTPSKDSPTFTGTVTMPGGSAFNSQGASLQGSVTAPTVSATDNSTKVATTAFVQNAVSGKANTISPAFTGTPTAPTAAAGTNTTQIATTAFVQTAVSGKQAKYKAVVVNIAVADWNNTTSATVNVTGAKADNLIEISPAPASILDYAEAGMYCTAQAAGTLTFECEVIPTSAISVNVVIWD